MKTIQKYPRYAITKDGKVFNKKTGRCLKSYVGRVGYKMVTLCRKGEQNKEYLHCILLETFVDSRPEDMECRHLDGNKLNNNLSNLKWGTRKENNADTKKHGSMVLPELKGEKHPMAKLTEQDVKLILSAYFDADYSVKELAKHFGIGWSMIYRIIEGKSWSYLWK